MVSQQAPEEGQEAHCQWSEHLIEQSLALLRAEGGATSGAIVAAVVRRGGELELDDAG